MSSRKIATAWLASFMALERKKFIDSLKRTAEVNKRYTLQSAKAERKARL
jgi:hypothetical protein